VGQKENESFGDRELMMVVPSRSLFLYWTR